MEINWDKIFRNLEKWRGDYSKSLQASSGVRGPAVSEVADNIGAGEYSDNNPWAVLVSTILSLRTKDDVTRAASKALLARAPTPQKLLKLGVERTAELAYPAGFYRTKAAQLQKIAAILLEKYDGQVPADMDALLELPGVGRKTANLVLTEAFDMYGICVDIHVHRICNRAGWICTKNPEETEMTLRKILPKKYWKRINGLLVFYGQHVCRPVSPFCSACIIKEYCSRKGIDKSR